MGISIHNGYRLKRNFPFEELQKMFTELRVEIIKAKTNIIADAILMEMIEQLDRREWQKSIKTGKSAFKELSVLEAYRQFSSEYRKACYDQSKSETRDPEHDLECRAKIIPIKGQLLALFVCERREYERIWEKLWYVEDFHYQNQTDRPKDISESDWLERKDLWDLAYTGGDAFGANYLFCDGETGLLIPSLEALLIGQPNKEARVQRLARKLVLDRKVSDLYYATPEGKKGPTDSSVGWMRSMSEALEFMQTTDGAMEIDSQQRSLRSVLPPLYDPPPRRRDD